MKCKFAHAKTRSTAGSRERRRGGAFVEFAVLIPFFVLMALGSIEYGRVMQVSQIVEHAAREGARMAAQDTKSTSDVRAEVNRVMQAAGFSTDQFTATIRISDQSGNSLGSWDVRYCDEDHIITVQVQIPYRNVRIIPSSLFQDYTLSSHSSMRREP